MQSKRTYQHTSLFIKALYLLIFTINGFSTEAVELVNFEKTEYKAASQNWSVAFDRDGIAYFGNSLGLLEFDGVSWILHPSVNGSIIRAVATDSTSRIYTAGYREVGYWERNRFNALIYHSLTSLVEQYFTQNEEIWNILVVKNKVYFQSFSAIYSYDGEQFQVLKPGGFINYSTEIDGDLFASIQKKGIYKITDKQMVPFIESSFFEDKIVRFFTVLNNPNSYLIGTESNGLFSYNALTNQFKEFAPHLTDFFARNKINRGLKVHSEKIIIGTILDGVLGIDVNQQLLFSHNKTQGLQSNTVLGVALDKNDNIWMALDRGISLMCSPDKKPYRIINNEKLGAVYSAAVYNNNLYLGTNQGLYCKSWPGNMDDYKLLPYTQQQVWDCKIIDNQLLIGHNSGTFLIDGDNLSKISEQSGGYSIIQHPSNPDLAIQSTYAHLELFKRKGGKWRFTNTIKGFNNLIRFIEFDHINNLWACHLYGNIYKLQLNERCDSVISVKQYDLPIADFKNKSNNRVFKIGGRLVFTSGQQLFTYNDLNDSIVPYTYLNTNLGHYASAHRIIKGQNHHYWFITKQYIGCFKILPNSISKTSEYPTSIFENHLVPTYENLLPLDDDNILVCLENGYALINTNIETVTDEITQHKPLLRKLEIRTKNGKTKALSINSTNVSVPFNYNSINCNYAFPLLNDEKVVYQYKLSNLNDYWSAPMDKPIFEINRIPSGVYTLSVKAINIWNNSSQIHQITISVSQPWYKSIPAIIIYATIILLLVLLSRNITKRKIKMKEQRIREEKEKKIIKLKNEKLESELSFKSQQIATSTMGIIKKNEFLMSLKHKIKRHKSDLGSRYPDKYYKELLSQIDENITGQDDWKLFETNFEQAHEAFLKSLKSTYPNLTPGDLRLCAYLRINLSSKEIASLLGISVRGVENHRSRVRKKLDLSAKDNLTDFILQL
ncbi:regulator [Carboxylicivirga sp. A043]|uniref:sigma factor-like helix-turn-helix DNA-binding protein n=1 Tax=Carboxylicivirga litoralis TaxID=2816963 RepID=UPI0021CAEF09|nr:sigma factor-like helix-turn-helix DNA-binding protein [Carboxylicivirga sp. A043]MCU4155870.1 regulator [Carboxylicivirga sp. A043]